MMSISRRNFVWQASVAAGLSVQPWRSALAIFPQSDIDFAAYRNGEWFGHHRLDFEKQDGKLVVEIDIAFDYKLAFIPLYRYRHRNREVWADGKLIDIATETDDNGTPYQVTGKTDGGRFLVDGSAGRLDLPTDILPTSYWNEAMIERREWLDTQHGKLVRADVTPKPKESLLVNGSQVEASTYELQGDINCTLWYHEHHWVGLRFVASEDSTIEYRIEPAGETG